MKIKTVTYKSGRLIALITIGIILHRISYAQEAKSCDKVLICHKGKNTLCIDDNAVKAHLDHGDYLGSCDDMCGVLATGGTITCTSPEVTLSSISNTSGVTYNWTGPNNFSSDKASPVVSTPGIYTLTIRDAANECSASDTALVTQTGEIPDALASGGNISCTNSSTVITGSSSTSGVTYSWNGPNNFTSTAQNPTVSAAGYYILTVTNPANGCISTDSAEVTENKILPGALSDVNGILTCSRTTVILSGNSSALGVTYQWKGPLTYASTEQNPVTSSPGTYILTVSNPVNGCTSKDSVIVLQDTSTARGIALMVSSSLNCLVKDVTLKGSSTTSGITFSWSGPNGFLSTDSSLTVSTPGNYIFHVCKQSTGCIAYANVMVLLDTIKPKGVVASASWVLGCTKTSVTITGSSTTNGVSYKWVGPDFASTEATANVTSPGAYFLTVTNPVNHCYTPASVNVTEDHSLPAGVTTSVSGKLTCTNPNVVVSATSTTPGVVYSWKGADNYISNERISSVNKPGIYLVTITNPYNDCKVNDSIEVKQDKTSPEGVSAYVTGLITCSDKTVTIVSSSSTPGVIYNWTGPYGFSSNMQNPGVSSAGVYNLTVIATINGCTTDTSLVVNENKTPPANVSATVSNNLDCVNAFVILSGSTTTPDAEYYWTGPDGFKENADNTFTITPGMYTLKVTDPRNDCSDSVTLTVVRDTVSPVCIISTPDFMPVALSENTLHAQIEDGISYAWGISSANPHWYIISGADSSVLSYHSGDAGSSATITLTTFSIRNSCSSTCLLTLSAVPMKSSALAVTQVYPNPFTDKAYIKYTPEANSYVTVKLYSIQGLLISTLFEGEIKGEATYIAEIDGNSLSAGVYYFIVNNETKQETISNKITLIK